VKTGRQITDDQIRDACNKFDLDPVGYVQVKPYVGRLSPQAGRLGFAAGRLSPGWQYLRDLCDSIAQHTESEWFIMSTYDGAVAHLQGYAENRARKLTWRHALVCVADLGVDETTGDARMRLRDYTGKERHVPLGSLAETLLSYAGYLVLREVFAPQIDSKRKD
jgi:hypothetical protein